jgi:hypothetical protein
MFVMDIYLPIAEMTVPIEAILGLSVVVGLLSGIFGVGGGFLATPFLIFMGVPPAVAVGTQANQLVASSSSGVLSHWKKGNVDVKMGGVMLAGSIFGSIVGVFIFRLFEGLGQIDTIIPILYVLILGFMGFSMLSESVTSLIKKKDDTSSSKKFYHNAFFQALPYKMRFPRSRIYVSAFLPAGLGVLGGLMVSVLGIGGGFLLVPAMIYILGMPPLLVVGTSLFQIMLSSIFATVMHAMTNHTVDFVLAFILIIGGVIGVQVGVRLSRFIKGAHGRIILSVIFLLICAKLAGDLFIPPLDVFSTEVVR